MPELMEHQKEALKNLGNGKVLWGGVGSGKTMTACAYYMQNEAPKDIVVITTAKKRDSLDWEGEFAAFGVSTTRSLSCAGTLVVDSWNNIGNYIDKEDAFFIFDEQRLVGNGAWVKAFQKIAKKNQWILLSATPGDTWVDYAPLFLANGLYRNVTEFKREHIVYAPFSKYPKIVRYVGVRTLEKYRNMLLVEMPYMKHTSRVFEEISVGYDEEMLRLVNVKRWQPYEDRPLTDVSDMFRTMRKVVNSDPSRLDAVRALLKDHPKLIIYYSFNYELDILRQLADEVEVAEWNGHRKHPLPTGDRWVYLVQYVAGAEGWNAITTDTMVFWSLTYSYKNFHQAQGRIDRLNTPFKTLYYFVLISDSVVDKAVKRSLDAKELFSERKFLAENWPEWG
jgi:hypothetical protein